jgi:hypothetical protein
MNRRLGRNRKKAFAPILSCSRHFFRVARWHIFKTKIPILVNLGGFCIGRCWYILWTLGPIYGRLVYFEAIWYILWLFGIFFPFWYVVPRKIWHPCFLFAPFFTQFWFFLERLLGSRHLNPLPRSFSPSHCCQREKTPHKSTLKRGIKFFVRSRFFRGS